MEKVKVRNMSEGHGGESLLWTFVNDVDEAKSRV